MKKLLALLLAVLMVVCLFAGCAPSEDPAEDPAKDPAEDPAEDPAKDPADAPAEGGVFKIGGIGPITGDAAIYGTAVMNGCQIAVDEINAAGGVNGAQIEFTFEDDVSDGETAINAYNKLVDDGMQALVGTVTTGPALSVSPILFEDRVFGLTPSASSADVTAGKDNMFQLCFTDPNQGISSAKYIGENMAGSKIAIIYRNDDAYSQGIRDAFVAEAANYDVEIVYEGTFTKDTQTDFSVQLTGAQAAGADLVYLPIYYQPASVIFNQAKQMGYAPTFFGVDGMDGILTLEGFDTSLAEGVMLMTPFNAWGTDELTANFVAEYESRYGETPNQFAADGYDCVYALKAALEKTECTPDMSAADICEKLVACFTSDLSVDGLTGKSMTWSEAGEVSKIPVVVKIQDGIYVNQ